MSEQKKDLSYSNYKDATKAIHAGQAPDPHTGAVMTPISLSSTFAQKSIGNFYPGNYEYSRSSNPTRDAFEMLIASLEQGKHGIAWSSGLGATTGTVNLLKTGDHLVAMDDCYGGTGRYLRTAKEKMGISLDFVDFTKEGWQKSIKKETKMVWVETPTNPTLKVVDIKAVAEYLKKNHPEVIMVVDNTFMSPILQKPLTLGADVVIHSVTKFINGHSDVVMGVTATSSDDIAGKLRYNQNAMGIIPSPFDCFMAIRGVKTLHLRMAAASENAMKVAKCLEASDKVEKVIYPGLPSHPQHEVFKKQTFGNSGMITFYLKGGEKQSRQFLENIKIITLAESLGGVESLAECPSLMTHGSVPAEMRKELGIEDNMIRLSVGVEDGEDLVEDVQKALDFVKN
eukprot:gene2254-2428_t